MKLLAGWQNHVDGQEDNEEDDQTTYLVEIDEEWIEMATKKRIRAALKEGHQVKGASPLARQLLAKEGLATASPKPVPKAPNSKFRGPLREKAGTHTKRGRGFTPEEQRRGASAGGKARWKGMSAKARAAAARKAVMARWAKKKQRR